MKRSNRQDPEYSAIIHSRKWRNLRRKKIIANPMCECCEREGRLTIATEVHHKIHLQTAKGATKQLLAFDWNNLESLCKECHINAHLNTRTDTKRQLDNFYNKYFE